ncbi:MAG: PAS domain S-box protein [Bacteroidetes bacterium]|nr:PAS domain S-box protein [Bacteroidota bacterium]
MERKPNSPIRPSLSLKQRVILLVAFSACIFGGLGIWLLAGLDEALGLRQHTEDTFTRLDRSTGKLYHTTAERHELISQMRMTAAEGKEDHLLILEGKAGGLAAIQQKEISGYTRQFEHADDRAVEASDALLRQLAIYNKAAQQLSDSLIVGNTPFADKLMSGTLSPAFVQIQNQLQTLRGLQKAQMLEAIASQTEGVQRQRVLGILFTILGALLLASLPILLFGRSFRYLRAIHPVLEHLQRGEVSERKLPETSDEVGRIARGINTVSMNLERAASFAHDVGQNKFDTEFVVGGKDDLLGSALVEMRDRLKAVADDEARRNWSIKGMAQFGEILRANQDLDTFADQIISNLTRYIDAIQGAFFLLQDGVSQKPELRLIGCYAYDRKKYMAKTFQLGEGLVGQAAMERGTIYLREVPQNYVNITSGLGQANPESLLVVPLMSNGQLHGVLEFAGFHGFEPHVIEFVEKLAENIASTLTHVKNNERNQQLLQETQRMAESLKANEEELRQNMEELQATHEEMNRLQQEMQGQLAAISRSNAMVEFDMKGQILTANEQFLDLMGYTLDEIKDRHHSIFVHPEESSSAQYRTFWEKLKAGEFQMGEFARLDRRGNPIWIMGTYNPILNAEGKPYKVVKFASDISESKRKDLEIQRALEESQSKEEELRQNAEEMAATQEEMARIQAELQGQMDAINRSNAVIEFDLKGNILQANANFLGLMGYTLDEVRGRHHSIFVDDETRNSTEYALHWQQLAQGAMKSGRFMRINRQGQAIWILGSYNPILDKDGKPYKIIKFAQDITKERQQQEEIRNTLEQVQAQEEELRQNAEEMAATQEEMKRVQAELTGQVGVLNAAALVSETDVAGNIIYCNDTFCEVAKYSREELIGQNHRMLKSGHQPQEIFERLWATVSSGKIFQAEIKNRAKDGSYYWVAATLAPVLGADGKPVKYIGVRFDITEQKNQQAQVSQMLEEAQAQEEELRQNAEEMAAQQEEMARVQVQLEGQMDAINRSNAVIEFDLKGNILFANENFLGLMGYTLDEIRGQHHRIFVSEQEQATEEYANHWSSLAEGIQKVGEFHRKRKDGRDVWILGTYNPILDKAGNPYKIMKFAQDITLAREQQEQIRQTLEEVQAQEEELRQNAEEMAATQEEMKRVQAELTGQVGVLNAAALVSETDVAGNIIYCNDTFCEVAKYSREELMGQNHRMLKSGHQPQEIFERLWATVSSGKTFQAEIKNRAKDGSYYWVAATLAPVLGADGKPVKYVGVRFDITDQKNQQEQVSQMLEETQAQEEELRQNAEEMAATQEEMARLQAELKGQLDAISRSTAVVEFDTRGNLLSANKNFLDLMGYKLEDIQGRHHRTFVDNSYALSDEYKSFWERLKTGEYISGEFRRLAKNGNTVWIRGSYNPIFNSDGVLYKYIKFAQDITESKTRDLDVEEKLAEAHMREQQLRARLENMSFQGLIELEDGRVKAANDKLLKAMGYEASELAGRHLAEFTEDSDLYSQLVSQQSQQKEFTLIAKNGKKMRLHGLFSAIDSTEGESKIIGMLKIG